MLSNRPDCHSSVIRRVLRHTRARQRLVGGNCRRRSRHRARRGRRYDRGADQQRVGSERVSHDHDARICLDRLTTATAGPSSRSPIPRRGDCGMPLGGRLATRRTPRPTNRSKCAPSIRPSDSASRRRLDTPETSHVGHLARPPASGPADAARASDTAATCPFPNPGSRLDLRACSRSSAHRGTTRHSTSGHRGIACQLAHLARRQGSGARGSRPAADRVRRGRTSTGLRLATMLARPQTQLR